MKTILAAELIGGLSSVAAAGVARIATTAASISASIASLLLRIAMFGGHGESRDQSHGSLAVTPANMTIRIMTRAAKNRAKRAHRANCCRGMPNGS
jgi:hypothetical protein